MTYVVTPDEMRAAEQRAIDSGRSEADLMRDAGHAVAEWIDERIHGYGAERAAFGLVGPGKNGGDTLVALARLTELGWSARAYFVDRSGTGNLPVDPTVLEQVTITDDLAAVSSTNVILDGIFGLGGRPELPSSATSVLANASAASQQHDIPFIAIDVPSGVDAGSGLSSEGAVEVDVTLTIGFLKSGLLHEPALTLAGDIFVIDLDLEGPDTSDSVRVITEKLVKPLFPRRRASSGKHDHGGLLVIGGSPTYFGAPRLAAESALRVGTGLVGAAVPRMLISSIASQLPEVIFLPLSDSDPRRSVDDIDETVTGEHARYNAIVLGPGLGMDDPAKALLSRLLGHASPKATLPIGFGAMSTASAETDPEDSSLASVPVVLDADALNWLADEEAWPSLLQNVTAVLTPHHGEMARLLGVETDEISRNPREIARSASKQWNQVVVLKGGHTTVAAPDGRVFVAHRATPELATPGTGDVLAGIIGGLLAQGFDPVDAACAAVYLGAEGGRIAHALGASRGIIARDLIGTLRYALDELDGFHMWS